MDISCAFVVTRFGDVIISKDYRFDGALAVAAPDFRRRLLSELDDDDDDDDDDDANRLPDDEPYFSVNALRVYFIFRNDFYVVACSRSRRPAVIHLDFLTRLFDLWCVLCRASPKSLDAKTLLHHQILVLEILDEAAARGQAQIAAPDKIRNLIYSPPPPPPSTSTFASSPSSSSAPSSSSTAVEVSTSSSSSIQRLAKLLPNAPTFLASPQLGSELTKRFDPGLFSTAYSVIPSALRQAVSSLAATAREASSDGDVFVDVVERVSLRVAADGKIEDFRLKGQLFVETRFKKPAGGGGGGGGVSSPKVKLFLPDDVVFETEPEEVDDEVEVEEAAEKATSPTSADAPSVATSSAAPTAVGGSRPRRAFTGSTTVLNRCVFHPRCVVDKLLARDAEERKPEMVVDSPDGEKIVALEYEVCRDLMKNPPPLHVDATVGERSSWKRGESASAVVSLVLTSRMPPQAKAAVVKVTLPIPDYVQEAARLTSKLPYIQGVEQSMEFDRKNYHLVWIVRHLPGKTSVDLETRLTWQPANSSSSSSSPSSYCTEIDGVVSSKFIPSSAADSPPFRIDVGPAFLEFELSGFSQSGFRIEALKFVDSTSFASTVRIKKETQNVSRWLRYITLDGKAYLFAAR